MAAGGTLTNGNAVTSYQGFGTAATLAVAGTYNANTVNSLKGLASVTISNGGTIALNAAAALAANGTFTNNGTLKLGATGTLITLSGTGGYTMNGVLNLNNLYGSAGSYTLISGGTATDTSVSITGYNTSAYAATFSAGVLTLTAVPEPSAFGLLGAGALAGVALLRRRRKA